MSIEDDKRAAQTAFLSAENIQELYQQIVSEGHILARGESLTRQIADGQFPLPQIRQQDITRSVEQEQDVEPER